MVKWQSANSRGRRVAGSGRWRTLVRRDLRRIADADDTAPRSPGGTLISKLMTGRDRCKARRIRRSQRFAANVESHFPRMPWGEPRSCRSKNGIGACRHGIAQKNAAGSLVGRDPAALAPPFKGATSRIQTTPIRTPFVPRLQVLTSICRGLAPSGLGIMTFRTPSLYCASIFSGATGPGNGIMRSNLPYRRSTR